MVKVKCKYCGGDFLARKADIKRGWGKFCNKTCKARDQEKKTGQYRKLLNRTCDSEPNCGTSQEMGWDSHKGHKF